MKPHDKMKPSRRPLVTRTELAQLLGCHPGTITKWERDGAPIAHQGGRGRPSRYDVAAVVAWRVAAAKASASDAPVSLEAERCRFVRAQAERQERENKVRLGELVEVAAVRLEYADLATIVKARLRAIPTRHAPALVAAAAGGPAAVQALLLEQIDEALRELARGADAIAGTA